MAKNKSADPNTKRLLGRTKLKDKFSLGSTYERNGKRSTVIGDAVDKNGIILDGFMRFTYNGSEMCFSKKFFREQEYIGNERPEILIESGHQDAYEALPEPYKNDHSLFFFYDDSNSLNAMHELHNDLYIYIKDLKEWRVKL